MTQYGVRPDYRAWLPLPDTFPWNDFSSDVEWATAVAHDRAQEDAPAAVRTAIAESALEIVRATPPLPGVSERYWWMPSIGRPAVVAHVTAVELDAPRREHPLDSFAMLGAGGMVQTLTAIVETAFDEALDCVLLIPAGEHTVALRRQLGRHADLLLFIDVFVNDGVALYEAELDISALFSSIELHA